MDSNNEFLSTEHACPRGSQMRVVELAGLAPAPFCGMLLAATCLWYMVIGNGLYGVVGLASMCTATPLVLLMVVATVGDAYVDARAALLRPDVSVRLAKNAGMNEAAIFAQSDRKRASASASPRCSRPCEASGSGVGAAVRLARSRP